MWCAVSEHGSRELGNKDICITAATSHRTKQPTVEAILSAELVRYNARNRPRRQNKTTYSHNKELNRVSTVMYRKNYLNVYKGA